LFIFNIFKVVNPLYIHGSACISPRFSDEAADLMDARHAEVAGDNRLVVAEPAYPGIPVNLLRRMGKAGRMGTGVCLPLMEKRSEPVTGIILGTANGGIEDSFRFLQQMVDYNEEALSPGAFVQSTANSFASQLSLMTGNRGYNNTHVHGGLAFEQALLDAVLLAAEDREAEFLVAGVDELSRSNFVLDSLQGWYSTGAIAGEGAAAFIVSGRKKGAFASLERLSTLHTDSRETMEAWARDLLDGAGKVDMVITGENGDDRLQPWYAMCENWFPADITVLQYKPGCGEYPTAAAIALWMACRIAGGAGVAPSLIKRGIPAAPEKILIYNNYQGYQHSLMLVTTTRH
jgi:hypothetical protein